MVQTVFVHLTRIGLCVCLCFMSALGARRQSIQQVTVIHNVFSILPAETERRCWFRLFVAGCSRSVRGGWSTKTRRTASLTPPLVQIHTKFLRHHKKTNKKNPTVLQSRTTNTKICSVLFKGRISDLVCLCCCEFQYNWPQAGFFVSRYINQDNKALWLPASIMISLYSSGSNNKNINTKSLTTTTATTETVSKGTNSTRVTIALFPQNLSFVQSLFNMLFFYSARTSHRSTASKDRQHRNL